MSIETTETDHRIRVLVVDDSAFTRRSLSRMFEGNSEIRVIDVACDGEMALAKVKELRPDVVTLDVQMPVLDGLATLARIMGEVPTPVIMLSSLTGRGGQQTIQALELGAVDFVDKCSVGGPMEIATLERELTQKIKVAASVKLPMGGAPSAPAADTGRAFGPAADNSREPLAPAAFPVSCRQGGGEAGTGAELVVLGTSTGGPAALTAVLSQLPSGFPAPILVVQHMPAGFTGPLAERLNRICSIRVKEAEQGELLVAGCAYIAPAGKHLKVVRKGKELSAVLELDPADTPHRPSVDVLFKSAAAVSGSRCRGFVLTGMGSDGAAGTVEIKKRGGMVFVESEETAVVNGMPGAAAAVAPIDGCLPLFEIAQAMARHV